MRLTTSERRVAKQLRAEGWKLYRAGWPDFLCIRTVNGVTEAKGVEVKFGQFATHRQIMMHNALRKCGIQTEIVMTGSLIPLKFSSREVELIERIKEKFGLTRTSQVLRMAIRCLVAEVRERDRQGRIEWPTTPNTGSLASPTTDDCVTSTARKH